MPEYRSMKYGILAVVVALALGLGWLGIVRYQAEQRALAMAGADDFIQPSSAATPEQAAEPVAPQEPVVVHVAGAVVAPGVYQLAPGARVSDAIAAAGGARPDGAPHVLNLADLVSDGAKVYVFTQEEAMAQGCLPAEAQGAGAAPTKSASTANATAPAASGKVNINTATVEQLDAVKYMTPKQAQAIVDYRKQHGPFKSLEDLDNVPGFGEATINKIRPYVSL